MKEWGWDWQSAGRLSKRMAGESGQSQTSPAVRRFDLHCPSRRACPSRILRPEAPFVALRLEAWFLVVLTCEGEPGLTHRDRAQTPPRRARACLRHFYVCCDPRSCGAGMPDDYYGGWPFKALGSYQAIHSRSYRAVRSLFQSAAESSCSGEVHPSLHCASDY